MRGLLQYILRVAFFALLCLLSPVLSTAANNTFTVTVPAGTEVTMLDAAAVIPLTVTNSASSADPIYELEFEFDPAIYTLSQATVAPTGWCVDKVEPDKGKIKFKLLNTSTGKCDKKPNGSEILPGASTTFNIIATPASAAADVTTDTLVKVKVKEPKGFKDLKPPDLPVWTRRSLELSMTATPPSTGVGGTITLTTLVTNRSTATQSAIASVPDPPTPSSASAAYSAGPYYGSTLLNGDHTSSTSVITVGDTSEFAASGTALIGTEQVCYTGKTATTLTGATRGCNSTTAAAYSSGVMVYSLDAFSLAPGEGRTIIWTYSAVASGSVFFTARDSDSTALAKSREMTSNTVYIGDFTATISLDPVSVVSGQDVTVTMTVGNNGTDALVNIVPTLSVCAGGATETLVSGPTPSSVSSLAASGSTVFTWTYDISGSPGDVYCFTGYASADGPVTSNTASSVNGTISKYSATVSPQLITSGTAPQTFTWSVYNGGACSLDRVTIGIPLQGGADWVYSTASSISPAGWKVKVKTGPDEIEFKENGTFISPGSTGVFSITFSTTETVTADKLVSFPVTVREADTGGLCKKKLKTGVGTYVTVSANAMTLAHSPAGPISADGSSVYTMTATLTANGSPVAGKTVSFSTTNGSLGASTAITDLNGQASVSLIAPNSTVDTTATVTATYLSAEATDTVNFTGWTGPDLQYWGNLASVPATTSPSPTISCGSSYSFTMDIKNISASASMNLTTASYFAFNGSLFGLTAQYKAFLDAPVNITPGSTVNLSFGSATSSGGGGGVTVSTDFVAGTYSPTINPTPPPESGLFFSDGGPNDQYRSVTDNITVSGSCTVIRINVIEWHEMR